MSYFIQKQRKGYILKQICFSMKKVAFDIVLLPLYVYTAGFVYLFVLNKNANVQLGLSLTNAVKQNNLFSKGSTIANTPSPFFNCQW